MKKPRATKQDASRMNRTVSLTGDEWNAIGRWSAERNMSRAKWMRECALTVELPTKKAAARPLVLDVREQRYISRTVGDLADGLSSPGDETAPDLGDDLRALLAARLRAMVRNGRREAAVELLRSVFGADRADIIAAAFIPEPQTTDEMTDGPSQTGPDDGSGRNLPLLGDLFGD